MSVDATIARRDSSTLQSVERACIVLEHLASCDRPQTASEVSRALEIERTATHRLLRSLLKSGLVRSERPGAYSVGPRALAIGVRYVEQSQVWRIALPYLMELSLEFADKPWTMVLGMFDGKDILLLERLWTRYTPLDAVIDIGAKMPVDRTAAGWAYLAQLPEEKAITIVGEPRFEQIRPKLELARRSQGMSFASGELAAGRRCPVGADHRRQRERGGAADRRRYRLPRRASPPLADRETGAADGRSRVGDTRHPARLGLTDWLAASAGARQDGIGSSVRMTHIISPMLRADHLPSRSCCRVRR